MPKASPMVRSFNAGEFSDLMGGRVDIDRYPASLKTMKNAVAAPQGPALSRSGTRFLNLSHAQTSPNTLIPFVFSNDQAQALEISDDRIRFLDEDGLQVQVAVAATVSAFAAGDVTITATGHGTSVGDEVVLDGFDVSYNLNGEVARITGVAGDVLTVTVSYSAPNAPLTTALGSGPVAGTVALVYHVPSDFTEQQRNSLRPLQSVDVIYLFSEFRRTRKISRFGTYDWRLEDVDYVDGPYLDTNTTATTLTPSGTGNAIPAMTSNVLPSGVCAGSGNRPTVAGTPTAAVTFAERSVNVNLSATDFFMAFDADDDTYWASDVNQSGTIQYTPATPFVCDGYTIYSAKDNKDISYTASDFAPSNWKFEGFDGTDWVVLDEQRDYVLYDFSKSVFFEVANETAYEAYRLNIINVTRNGPIEPRVRRLALREADNASFDLAASSTTGINNDQGFLSTDEGRQIRLRGSDGGWRPCVITAVNSTTSVTVELRGEPLLDTDPIRQWRLGYWSDTTGWPNAGEFFEDRLWLVGSDEFPDLIAGSVTGQYETFSQTDTFGEVLDTSAIVVRLNARKLSRARWISSDSRGLLVGTGAEEYTITAPTNDAITPTNIRARAATRRGSGNVEPVRVDSQVLYAQRGDRTIREFVFVFESDGYKSPSMSQLASHLGAVPFAQMEYAAEPYSVVWCRRTDGALVGLTYDREENVIGWHQQDLAGAAVESMAVIPQKDGLQDALLLSLRRTVNGQTVRYNEVLTPFWDFDKTLAVAQFVDSGLRYQGVSANVIYGLQHLEGETVYGLADELIVGPLVVTNGQVELPFAATNVVLGLGYETLGVLPRLENGAADGTAQGKVKRINSVALHLWQSFGGEIGVFNKETDEILFDPIEYPGSADEFEAIDLYTGIIDPVQPAPGYDLEGIMAFRRPPESPLPFNVVAVMPQLTTQDR